MKASHFAKEVMRVIPSIHAQLVRSQPPELLKGRISLPQMVILDILSLRDDCKMSDLSKILGVTKSAVTGITDRLIRAGLLKRMRSKVDRRVVKIHLSHKGLTLAKRLYNFKLKMVDTFFSNISQKERIEYLKILRKVQANINKRQ